MAGEDGNGVDKLGVSKAAASQDNVVDVNRDKLAIEVNVARELSDDRIWSFTIDLGLACSHLLIQVLVLVQMIGSLPHFQIGLSVETLGLNIKRVLIFRAVDDDNVTWGELITLELDEATSADILPFN